MILEILVYFLLLVFLLGIFIAYIHWFKFVKNTRKSEKVNEIEVKDTAKRIGYFSFFAGVAGGILMIIMRITSYPNSVDDLGLIQYIAILFMCSIGSPVLYLGAFFWKATLMRSLYGKSE